MPVANNLLDIADKQYKIRALESVLRGLEAARIECVMFNQPTTKVDTLIYKYKQRLVVEREGDGGQPSPTDTPDYTGNTEPAPQEERQPVSLPYPSDDIQDI